MRFFVIRGLAMPAVFLLSIVLSFFSVQAAIYSWFILIAVDAFILFRRGMFR